MTTRFDAILWCSFILLVALGAMDLKDTEINGLQGLAAQGDASGQTRLATAYREGRGVKRNLQQAMVWYKNAAAQGDSLAAYQIGAMYNNGEGVPQDYQEALGWFLKAAEKGNGLAQYLLGVYYEEGRGVSANLEESRKWFALAEESGVPEAKLARQAVENRIASPH